MKDVKIRDIYITVILMAVNLLLFIVPLIICGCVPVDVIVRLGAQYWPFIKAGEWWRLIICNFLHFSAEHLMFNMIALFALGTNMEPCLGHLRYAILYMLSGIGGSTLSYVVNMLMSDDIVAAGASTSVYGLLGAMACIVFLGFGERVGIRFSKKRFFILAFINVAGSVWKMEFIDIAGHAGGFVTGVLVCLVMMLLTRRKHTDGKTET